MNETAENDVRMTKKQKTVLIVLVMVALCLILTSVTVFWVLPGVMRSRFRLAYTDLILRYSAEYDLEPAFRETRLFREIRNAQRFGKMFFHVFHHLFHQKISLRFLLVFSG